MKDTLIQFKTAKLAKERKFNWGCNNYFDEELGDIGKIKTWIDDRPMFNTYNRKSKFFAIRPTQSLLQKWLREKHKINIYVEPEFHSLGDKYKVTGFSGWLVQPNNKTKIIASKNKTYEDALEKGLFESLKLIMK